jgi:hypothetical protein
MEEPNVPDSAKLPDGLQMDVQIEISAELLTATISGVVEFGIAIEKYKMVFDCAAAEGCKCILIDCTALQGELSTLDRFMFGEEAAKCQYSGSSQPRIAFIGMPPVLDGFGVLVSRNRGVNARIFPTHQEALEWLTGPLTRD